jgi:hypothetical protein
MAYLISTCFIAEDTRSHSEQTQKLGIKPRKNGSRISNQQAFLVYIHVEFHVYKTCQTHDPARVLKNPLASDLGESFKWIQLFQLYKEESQARWRNVSKVKEVGHTRTDSQVHIFNL